ncbi:MAG: thiopurine S-methyltransferase [Hahellaceae bacterium]|jgi:thiopurine S-methyltransferase|nr:thiopurine S-methyltransferase [Hahellaceae bacterium]MCP5211068.1 thiopurine S-methyltransferase [Hahellaceae bacterium]
MDHDFWHDRWHRKEIGFHQPSINHYLNQHWSELSLQRSDTVFVPLCGKSRDMFWINDKGHPIKGVELSPIACKDLFEEANLTAQITHEENFSHYQHDSIDILCGDFFKLTVEHMKRVKAVYDRAALIALPPEMRQQYVNHLNQILPQQCKILLVALAYPQQEMSGPPFSVTTDEILSLYGAQWTIETITENLLGKDDPFTKRTGLSEVTESAYLLKRKD